MAHFGEYRSFLEGVGGRHVPLELPICRRPASDEAYARFQSKAWRRYGPAALRKVLASVNTEAVRFDLKLGGSLLDNAIRYAVRPGWYEPGRTAMVARRPLSN